MIMVRTLTQTAGRRDATVLGAAILAVAAGVASGWPAPALALAVAILPAAGFLLAGHVPGRGAAAGCLALALGSTLMRPVAGMVAWGDLALLGCVAMVACFGASQARRMSGAIEPVAAGRWVTIVVSCEDPSGPAARTRRPKVSPHPAPERRTLVRLAGERLRGRRPALAR